MDSNNQIETCLSRKSSEDKPQIFTTLRNIDLNLLTIFEAVYVHKGIVNAAKVLNLTPSAISQSIQKLRVIFPDPLFIRKGQGVTPTATKGSDMKSLRLMLCAMPLMLTGCSTMSSVNWSAANPWNWFGSSTKVSEQGVGELTASTPLHLFPNARHR